MHLIEIHDDEKGINEFFGDEIERIRMSGSFGSEYELILKSGKRYILAPDIRGSSTYIGLYESKGE